MTIWQINAMKYNKILEMSFDFANNIIDHLNFRKEKICSFKSNIKIRNFNRCKYQESTKSHIPELILFIRWLLLWKKLMKQNTGLNYVKADHHMEIPQNYS